MISLTCFLVTFRIAAATSTVRGDVLPSNRVTRLVSIRIRFSSFGVRYGYTLLSNATNPAVTGDVDEMDRNGFLKPLLFPFCIQSTYSLAKQRSSHTAGCSHLAHDHHHLSWVRATWAVCCRHVGRDHCFTHLGNAMCLRKLPGL